MTTKARKATKAPATSARWMCGKDEVSKLCHAKNIDAKRVRQQLRRVYSTPRTLTLDQVKKASKIFARAYNSPAPARKRKAKVAPTPEAPKVERNILADIT